MKVLIEKEKDIRRTYYYGIIFIFSIM